VAADRLQSNPFTLSFSCLRTLKITASLALITCWVLNSMGFSDASTLSNSAQFKAATAVELQLASICLEGRLAIPELDSDCDRSPADFPALFSEFVTGLALAAASDDSVSSHLLFSSGNYVRAP
jgi:hypothetical protein